MSLNALDEKSLGARLKKMRVAKRWTQTAVADKMGVSITSVCNWEKGYTRPRAAAQRQLANLYGISLAELSAGLHIGEYAKPNLTLQDNSKTAMDRRSLPEVITHSRQAIANSAGISSSSVKITLHYGD